MGILAYTLLGGFVTALAGMSVGIGRNWLQERETDRNVAARKRRHRLYRVTQRAGAR